MPYVNNKGTDQPVHPHSLISAFVGCFLDSIIPTLDKFQTFKLASVGEEVGLSLTLVQTPKDRFSRDMAQIYIFRFVSVGPRLSSFLIDLNDEDINMADCSTMLPVRTDQTLQICGYPLRDVPQHLLDRLLPHVVFNEYGVQVSFLFHSF